MASLLASINWAIETCNKPDVGYSQRYRNEQRVNNITYYDCSSFIWYALKYGDFDVNTAYQSVMGNPYSGNAITTSYEERWLLELGFVQQNIQGEWKRGDILWRSGHTEMVYSGGMGQGVTMGAHTSNTSLANQVSINNTPTPYTKWTHLWRYTGGDVTNKPSIYVISAICGNWWQESGINPAFWEGATPHDWTDLNVGYGLGQWTNTGGDTHGRLYQLYNYLTTHGYDTFDGNGQLEYFLSENAWIYSSDYPEFHSLNDFLHSGSHDIEYLTHAFNRCWEGIHDSSWDIRVTYAENCYNYILNNWNNTSITDWIISDSYLPDNSRYNNAVMVYRYLTDDNPPTPTPPTPIYSTKKMPLFMMLRRRY